MSFRTIVLAPRLIASQYGDLRRASVSHAWFSYTLIAVAIVSVLAFGVLTQWATESIYQSRSLEKSVRALTDDIARHNVTLVQIAQKPGPGIEIFLAEMQKADTNITYIHTNAAFVDASSPQP